MYILPMEIVSDQCNNLEGSFFIDNVFQQNTILENCLRFIYPTKLDYLIFADVSLCRKRL